MDDMNDLFRMAEQAEGVSGTAARIIKAFYLELKRETDMEEETARLLTAMFAKVALEMMVRPPSPSVGGDWGMSE